MDESFGNQFSIAKSSISNQWKNILQYLNFGVTGQFPERGFHHSILLDDPNFIFYAAEEFISILFGCYLIRFKLTVLNWFPS